MTDLTPAAQAVLDAVFDHWPGGYNHPGKPRCVAAAIRAVVLKCEYTDDYGTSFIDPKDLLAIATELDGK